MDFKSKKYSIIINSFSTCGNKGFSLLEVIFSIGIITVGIVSILTLFNYNLKAEINNKNKLIAIYLAQESIEVIRQNRDNVWFRGDTDFLDENEFSDDDVIVGLVDSDNNRDNIREGWEIIESNLERRKVYLSDDPDIEPNSYYVQHRSAGGNWAGWGWEETGFERYLEIDNSVDGTGTSCARIISHVSFNGTEIVTITAYLYDDWY